MARGFGAGLFWGLVVMGAGLAALSLLAPPPVSVGPEAGAVGAGGATEQGDAVTAPTDEGSAGAGAEPSTSATDDKAAADAAAAEAAEKAAAEKAAADKAAADAATEAAARDAAAAQEAADKAASEAAAQEAADKAAREAAAQEAVDKAAEQLQADTAARHKIATETPAAADAVPLSPEPPEAAADSPDTMAASEVSPATTAPSTNDDVPSLAGLDQALIEPDSETAPLPAEPAPTEPEGPGDALSEPGQPQGQTEPQRLPQIAPAADPELSPEPPAIVTEPSEDPTPESSPGVAAQERSAALPPVKPLENKLPNTVLDKVVPGVKVDGLPQIGAEPTPEETVELPPIRRFAREFAPEGKPLFVILLRDIGAAGMARDELAKLPFAVSFVIDPLATDASAASAAYRAAGQEVLTLANGIPQGAEASDLETTFATLSTILPESVAIVDQDLGGFQDSRPLATLVLPVIKGEGRGLITYDRGLNAADQIARREEVPAAVIFRRLDGEDESKQTIRRYLDRAAFKAAQVGSVVVIGDTKAETVAAILEWTIEGKAATVSLAPATAVLK